MLWNMVNRTPVLNYIYSIWKVWGRLKTSCHPPFFIRLTVQLFCDSLLTFMKQRESKPKLICIHICRKCLNAFQKRKINWSLNKLNKKSHSVQYQLTAFGEFSNKWKQLGWQWTNKYSPMYEQCQNYLFFPFFYTSTWKNILSYPICAPSFLYPAMTYFQTLYINILTFQSLWLAL
jgi:hypothetical protein